MLAGSKLRAIWLPVGILLASGGLAVVERGPVPESPVVMTQQEVPPAASQGENKLATSEDASLRRYPARSGSSASASLAAAVPDDLPIARTTKDDKSEEAYSFLEPRHFKAVEVTATGYYAGRESTGKSPGHPEYGITFSGVKVRKALFSTVAADTRVFPLGTILYIPGYGYGVVADTGSAIKGKKLDLYFETKRQVYERWGKKKVKVSVLRRGNGQVTEAMLDRLNGIVEAAGRAQP
ncbi:3D domain-containing protein [Gorillibacterium timonense]|uniref:3D domain-containing protein n=1 Tax=Gorillibacterium timonense TaxID=1689269 RepID=UPI000AC929C7